MTPSRRQVLSAGAVAVVAGCTRDRAPAPLTPDPDALLVAAAVAREQALLDAYSRVLATDPGLGPALTPLLGNHAAHLARLRSSAAATPAAATPAAATPSATATAGAMTVAALRALERVTAAAHAQAAHTASRGLAPLLASLAACEAVHAAVLP